MKNARASSAVSSFPALVAVGILGAFSILVAVLELSALATLALLPLPILLSYGIARAAMGMPATIRGNVLPGRYQGRRYQLVAMPINHFGERLRWCMDLVGAPYEETTVAGILSLFLRGRTVPWLVDRKSCSLIGNSDEALWYLSAVHVPTMPGPGRELARALLRRNADTIVWEGRLNALGHAIQGWAYFYLLAPDADPEHSLRMWGSEEPLVPRLQRWSLKLGQPVLKALLRRAFNLSDAADHEKRRDIIVSVLDDADAALSRNGGSYLTGAEMSYVDVSFCALLGLLAPNVALPYWARGRFASLLPMLGHATWPSELSAFENELRARPCGEFIEKMFQQWRNRSFDTPERPAQT